MVEDEKHFSLSQRMAKELGAAIVCGEYKPNQGLPTEAELCDRFGVSRTAVREAIKMLVAKGLISSRPRQGIKVLAEQEWNIFDTDVLLWSLDGNLSLKVLREFMQMRLAIEPEAAALGAKLRDAVKISAISESLRRMKTSFSGGDELEMHEASASFHISVLYSSENRFFIRMRDFIRTALEVSIRHTSVLQQNPDGVIEAHAKVYQAMRAGNSEAARQAMSRLIGNTLLLIELKLEGSR